MAHDLNLESQFEDLKIFFQFSKLTILLHTNKQETLSMYKFKHDICIIKKNDEGFGHKTELIYSSHEITAHT